MTGLTARMTPTNEDTQKIEVEYYQKENPTADEIELSDMFKDIIKHQTPETKFTKWLDTFLSEKGIDVEFESFEVSGQSGINWIPMECLLEMIKSAPTHEQEGIKDMLVKIDFQNGNVLDYFRHLARAIAR